MLSWLGRLLFGIVIVLGGLAVIALVTLPSAVVGSPSDRKVSQAVLIVFALMIWHVAVLTRGTERSGIRGRLWHSPFLIVLTTQILAAIIARRAFLDWWKSVDCEPLRRGSGIYHCPGDGLLPLVWLGLLCLAALPFALAQQRQTRIAALVATWLGLLQVVYVAVRFVWTDVTVTFTKGSWDLFVPGPVSNDVVLSGYASAVQRFWLLTWGAYLVFWAWDARWWVREQFARWRASQEAR